VNTRRIALSFWDSFTLQLRSNASILLVFPTSFDLVLVVVYCTPQDLGFDHIYNLFIVHSQAEGILFSIGPSRMICCSIFALNFSTLWSQNSSL
jgi:hypothetical protein